MALAPKKLGEGVKIRVHSHSTARLNGAVGVILKDQGDGLWEVELSSPPECVTEHPNGLSIHGDNLKAKDLLEDLNDIALEALLEMTIAIREGNKDDWDVIHITSYLAGYLLKHGRPEEALPHAQRVYDWVQRFLPEGDVGLVPSMFALGGCMIALGRLEEAERLMLKALDITQRAEGHADPETIDCLVTLAATWSAMGKHDKAEALLRRAVGFHEQQLGRGHEKTIQSITGLALGLLAQTDKAKTDDAASLMEEVVKLNLQVHGLQHLITINSIHTLGRVYVAGKEYKRAEVKLRQAVKLSQSVCGPHHDRTLSVIGELITCLVCAQELSDAARLGREHLQALERHRGQDHPDTVKIMCKLVYALCLMERFSEAEPLARKALKASTRVLGPNHPTTKQAAVAVELCRASLAAAAAQEARSGKARQA